MTVGIAPTAPTTDVPSDLPRLRRVGPAKLHRLARRLADRTDLWRPHVRFAHESRWSVRVAVTSGYEAWLLTWLPGQSTGLHDHGGSAGAFTVLEGEVEESTLAPSHSRGPAALVHRTLTAGRVRAFGAHHVHDVTNTGSVPAVSLHVYAPALETMRRFVLDDEGRLQVVSLEVSGTDW
jgi:predicted metal-dependent enzyme (double-stranded beta helix superfamily)